MPQPARRWGRPPTPVLTLPTPVVDLALWEEAVAAFLTRCTARDLRPKSLDLYRHVLLGGPEGRVQIYRDEHGITRVDQFTATHLRAFESELFAAGLASGTVVVYHRTLRTFLRFCSGQGIAVDPAVLAVEGPLRDFRRPDVFTTAETTQLLAAAKGRDKVIVDLFLRTGIRLEELTLLDVGDVVLGPGLPLIRVQGKMRKDRFVPLDTKTYRMSTVLRRHIEQERRGARPSEPLFVSRFDQRLDESAVKSMLQRLGRSVGVHCHAHKFRHTYATRMLAAGADALELQQALGHTTLTMVSRYVHFDAGGLTRSFARLET